MGDQLSPFCPLFRYCVLCLRSRLCSRMSPRSSRQIHDLRVGLSSCVSRLFPACHCSRIGNCGVTAGIPELVSLSASDGASAGAYNRIGPLKNLPEEIRT